MEIKFVPIASVTANPDNPRIIKDDAFRRLVKSLQECPQLFNARPLLCSDRTGKLIILGGNMRHAAAKELKYKEVPIIAIPGLTERQEKEIAIKDNGSFGEWDFDLLANEWSDLPLIDWGVDIAICKEEKELTTDEVIGGLKYEIIVECSSESEQLELISQFEDRGLVCRPQIL